MEEGGAPKTGALARSVRNKNKTDVYTIKDSIPLLLRKTFRTTLLTLHLLCTGVHPHALSPEPKGVIMTIDTGADGTHRPSA